MTLNEESSLNQKDKRKMVKEDQGRQCRVGVHQGSKKQHWEWH